MNLKENILAGAEQMSDKGYSVATEQKYYPDRRKMDAQILIHNLAGQALDQAMPKTWTTLTTDDLSKFTEVFAELVAKECALTAGLMEHEGRKNIGAVILDRFGVDIK